MQEQRTIDLALQRLLEMSAAAQSSDAIARLTREAVVYVAEVEASVLPALSATRWRGVPAEALGTWFDLKRQLATLMVAGAGSEAHDEAFAAFRAALERHGEACREALWPLLDRAGVALPTLSTAPGAPGAPPTTGPLDVSAARQVLQDAAIALSALGTAVAPQARPTGA